MKKKAPKKPPTVGKKSGSQETKGAGRYSATGTADRAAGAEATKRYGKNAKRSGGSIGGTKKPKDAR